MVPCNVNISRVQRLEFLVTLFTGIGKIVGEVNRFEVVSDVSLIWKYFRTIGADKT